ncbi:MAG: arylmalonate decarboxylase [Alphaproteobacteria bacterium]|nr:arylmalonate decarboxylase [Alphaproteobacteria bacterium]
MGDTLGHRLKIGVIIPSTNTSVQPELDGMRPAGVTNHIGRIYMENLRIGSDADFEKIVRISTSIDAALDQLMTCEVDHLILGVAPDAFWDGPDANERLHEHVTKRTGKGFTRGADASLAAMQALGSIKSIAIIAPFLPAQKDITRFYRDHGYRVLKVKGMGATSAVNIAHVSEEALREAILEVDSKEIDAILQVGSNLPMARVAAEAETWLGKPVLSLNTASYWRALRTCGISDRVRGFGTLLDRL